MVDMLEKNEVVQFKDGEFTLEVNVTPNNDNIVWLSQKQIAELFNINRTVVGRHIKNIFNSGELDETMCANFAHMGKLNVQEYSVKCYCLDVILAVGYRTNSSRGILFRKWANNILNDYLLKGYAINERHYQDIDYITKVLNEYKLAGGKLPSSDSMLEFLTAYQRGFKILDDYDHHSLDFPKGEKDIYIIGYDECINLIRETMFSNKGDLFAIERDNSF